MLSDARSDSMVRSHVWRGWSDRQFQSLGKGDTLALKVRSGIGLLQDAWREETACTLLGKPHDERCGMDSAVEDLLIGSLKLQCPR